MFWSGLCNTYAFILCLSTKFHVLLEKKVLPLQDLTFQSSLGNFLTLHISNTKKVHETQHSLLNAVERAVTPQGTQSTSRAEVVQYFYSWIRLQYSWVRRTQGGLGQWHSHSQMCMCTCLDLPPCLWHWKLLFNLRKWISEVFLPHFCLRFPRGEKDEFTHGGQQTDRTPEACGSADLLHGTERWQRMRNLGLLAGVCLHVGPAQSPTGPRLSSAHSLLLCGCVWRCEPQM